jgi:hypothetical protein
VLEEKSAAVGIRGRGRSGRPRYSRRAVTVVGWSGTRRDLPNLVSRIVSVPARGSRSSRSSRIASPTRSPATASRPMSVVYVAAPNGVCSVSAVARMSAAISASLYRYGVARPPGSRSSSAGMSSWTGSSAWRWAAKPRTTVRRMACQREPAPAGSVAQASAASTVIVSAAWASRYAVNWASSLAVRWSPKPSERRRPR